MTIEEMVAYDIIVDNGIATPEELNLAFNMTNRGWSWTLNRVMFVRTGYSSLEQYLEAEDDAED